MRLADRIAYVNHDIDDAIRADVMRIYDIPFDVLSVLGDTKTKRINTLIKSIVGNSHDDTLCMSPQVQSAFDILHSFMYEFVYTSKKI